MPSLTQVPDPECDQSATHQQVVEPDGQEVLQAVLGPHRQQHLLAPVLEQQRCGEVHDPGYRVYL